MGGLMLPNLFGDGSKNVFGGDATIFCDATIFVVDESIFFAFSRKGGQLLYSPALLYRVPTIFVVDESIFFAFSRKGGQLLYSPALLYRVPKFLLKE